MEKRLSHRVHNPGFKVRFLVSLKKEKKKKEEKNETKIRKRTLPKSGKKEKRRSFVRKERKKTNGKQHENTKETTSVDTKPVTAWK